MTSTAPVSRTSPPANKPPGRSPVAWLLVFVVLAMLLTAFVAVVRTGGPSPAPETAVFPLPEQYANSYANDWGAPRPQGRHEGTDIYAPEGTPVYSMTSGTVTLARGSDEDGWNTLGGYTVTVRADRDAGLVERGDYLYYAHLDAPSPLEPADRVVAGQEIGAVGRTAGQTPGTQGDFPPHLHVGWYDGGWRQERAETESGAVNPYPLLRGIGRGFG